jgi:hypothetical protein
LSRCFFFPTDICGNLSFLHAIVTRKGSIQITLHFCNYHYSRG